MARSSPVGIDLDLHDHIGGQIEAAGEYFVAGQTAAAARLLREAADRIDPKGADAAIQAVREERDRQYEENVSLIVRNTAMLEALERAQQVIWQYTNDLRYPPEGDSLQRRLDSATDASFAIHTALTKARGNTP